VSDETKDASQTAGALPKPNVMMFMAGLHAQALMFLGVLPDPSTGKQARNEANARHLIDTIELLAEKMTGNLTDEESQYTEQVLYDLRMRFVQPPSESAGDAPESV
jgi:uncharacterized protein DUF1844